MKLKEAGLPKEEYYQKNNILVTTFCGGIKRNWEAGFNNRCILLLSLLSLFSDNTSMCTHKQTNTTLGGSALSLSHD